MPGRGPSEVSGEKHGAAMAGGAAVGALVAAAVAGGPLLLIILAGGAVCGALLLGIGQLALDRVRGEPATSGDHPMPTLSADGGPDAQRAEAGATSPSSSG